MAQWEHKIRDHLRAAGPLAALTAVLALLLVLLGGAAAPVLAEKAQQRLEEELTGLVPDADVFSQVYFQDESISDIYGAYESATLKGYCVEVERAGFSGPIRMLVGVDVTGDVTGVRLTEQSETWGVGSRVGEENFLARFIGASGTLHLGSGANSVYAVSGATVSSQAVTDGVNAALAAVVTLTTQGGGEPDENGAV